MGFRFFTRKQILPGVALNLSGSGPSISIGPKGFKHTIGPRGSRTTVGLPGTGLFYTVDHGKGKKRKTDSAVSTPAPLPPSPPRPNIDPAAASRIVERDFLRALVLFQGGDRAGALSILSSLPEEADVLWLRGLAHLLDRDWAMAADLFDRALARENALGKMISDCGISIEIAYPITPEITAHIGPEPRATILVMAEARQAMGEIKHAAQDVQKLLARNPDDVVAMLSLAELVLEDQTAQRRSLEDLRQRLEMARQEDDFAWMISLSHARTLIRLDRPKDAIAAYTRAIEDVRIPEDAQMSARYELALAHEETGDRTRCRQELSVIHAIDPTFADVDVRLRSKTR